MASGVKELNMNSRERAVSTDINRLQKFANAFAAEVVRAEMDTGFGADDLDASGVDVVNAGVGSPLVAEVANGLCVRPQVGNLVLFVTPGVLGVVDPDGAPDDSDYKRVVDAGVPTGTSLLVLANSSGQTRVDVVESQPTSATVESDNRDVFDLATGVFAPTTVPKAIQTQLVYRVRAGTPGAGFPGTAAGWLPLAVASVPNATTTNDTVTFWDVRPLVADRIVQPHRLTRDFGLRNKVVASATAGVVGGKTILVGVADVIPWDVAGSSPLALYRLGGRLRTGTPLADSPSGVDGVDVANVANSDGAGLTASSYCYVYLLEPFGLPRWARYTDATTGTRKPRSPRGIVVVSKTTPVSGYGSPSAAVALPANTGLGGSATRGMCVMMLGTDGGSLPVSGIADGSTVWIQPPMQANASLSGLVATWNLTEGMAHPGQARSLWVDFTVQYSVGSSGALQIIAVVESVLNAGGVATVQVGTQTWFAPNTGGGYTGFHTFRMRVPLVLAYPGSASPTNRQITLTLSGTSGLALDAATSISVVGYDAGS